MKAFLIWLFVAVLSGCCVHSVARHPASHASTVDQLKDATVALVRTDSDGDNVSYCTGVWIAQERILTAQHCAESYGRIVNDQMDEDVPFDATGMQMKFVVRSDVDLSAPNNWPKTTRLGEVVAIDKEHDLALIKTSAGPRGHMVASVDPNERVPDGARLHIVGHTVGMWWTYSAGVAANSWTNMKGPAPIQTYALQVAGPVWGGNSGGGAFDEDGHLVGIASWINGRAPSMSFFIHHNQIVDFLRKNQK